jgi:hypothetical protein
MTAVITKRLALRGEALNALSNRASEILLCGAAGTGKSYGLLWKAHLLCMSNPRRARAHGA